MSNYPKIAFYATPEHDCSYLDNEKAITLFADPAYPKDTELYSLLARNGFRRSGEHVYQPHCADCQKCVSVRVPVNEFKPNRSQRRNSKLNQDIEIKTSPAAFEQTHYELFDHYIKSRHKDGGMDDFDIDAYKSFLMCSWANTELMQFYLKDELIAIAVMDELTDGLSAVYSFFSPELSKRALGKFAILSQIKHAQERGLDYLYLGYWIGECQKMSYKDEYQPLQYFMNGNWYYRIEE